MDVFYAAVELVDRPDDEQPVPLRFTSSELDGFTNWNQFAIVVSRRPKFGCTVNDLSMICGYRILIQQRSLYNIYYYL